MGRVESIHIAAEHEERAQPVERVRAVAEQGLEGDRQWGKGDITLIEAEALEGLAREHDIELAPGESRRQITTRGIALNDLVGERFRVGEVECVGTELCEPCNKRACREVDIPFVEHHMMRAMRYRFGFRGASGGVPPAPRLYGKTAMASSLNSATSRG